jgi:hypothetical protein
VLDTQRRCIFAADELVWTLTASLPNVCGYNRCRRQWDSSTLGGGDVSQKAIAISTIVVLALPIFGQRPTAANWIDASNNYTNTLLALQMKHSPEFGSEEGLSEFDTKASQPTLADEDQLRRETESALKQLKAAAGRKQQEEVKQDLQIMIHSIELGFKEQDFERAHEVPFFNASSIVFGGLRILLDDQTVPSRRPAAVARLRAYAGSDAYKPITDILKQRVIEQMAKPGLIYPLRTTIETELGRNSSYLDGIAALFTKYKLTGWQDTFETLKTQLTDYDRWFRATVLPKARTDFRLPPEEYALNLERVGIDVPPGQVAAMAHQAFTDIQAEMKPIAMQIAEQQHLPSSDYRDVIRELKKKQLVGDEILPFYENRLQQIEKIIVDNRIVTLPNRSARIRIATAAETAQQPAPHFVPPPFLNNTGQEGEFVLPLNIPAAPGQSEAQQYDDFAYDAAAWTMTAHEARPGHEVQFDSMLEHGVSRARVLYAFNSTNVEGWGLYSEYLMEPYMPLEGQLVSLDYRLFRAARAFLDPELQSGKIHPEDAQRVLENDVVLSPAFTEEEIERFTYRDPGQAIGYFYGYTKLIVLRKATETALGAKFNQKKFHDFILAQGMLPPDLIRKAVMEHFIPSQQTASASSP